MRRIRMLTVTVIVVTMSAVARTAGTALAGTVASARLAGQGCPRRGHCRTINNHNLRTACGSVS
jgi:hypothetical protein